MMKCPLCQSERRLAVGSFVHIRTVIPVASVEVIVSIVPSENSWQQPSREDAEIMTISQVTVASSKRQQRIACGMSLLSRSVAMHVSAGVGSRSEPPKLVTVIIAQITRRVLKSQLERVVARDQRHGWKPTRHVSLRTCYELSNRVPYELQFLR